MSEDKEVFEKTYEKPGVIWTASEPPKELVELVKSGKIKPGKALDMGCGEGFYAIYLASKGFKVLGIDISENAIKYAKENAKKHSVDVRFMVLDVTDLSELGEKFDFVFEWSLMHHIMPSQRQKYVKGVSRILKKHGKYLSISFNEKSARLSEASRIEAGKKLRTVPSGAATPAGVKIYFSSLEELKDLFKPHFRIIEAKLIQMQVGIPHIGNYLLMERL